MLALEVDLASSLGWAAPGGFRTIPLDLAPTRARVNRHSIGLSVRYGR